MDSKGKKINVEMGSYGIGISRLVAAIIESSHDEKGIIWPRSIAPFAVGIINLKPQNSDLRNTASKIYRELSVVEVPMDPLSFQIIYDDTSNTAGEKFANMDLIGIPTQIIIGENYLKDQTLEIKDRKTKRIIKIKYKNIEDIVKHLPIIPF